MSVAILPGFAGYFVRRVCALFAVGLLWSVGAGTAVATDCYRAAEYEAEQTIRLHTEMMVIGIKCNRVRPDMQPFALYAAFTQRNSGWISRVERDLIGYYRRTRGNGAVGAFDRLRTSLANEYARKANMIPTEDYCIARLPVLARLAQLDQARFRTAALRSRSMPFSRRPVCTAAPSGETTVAANR